MDKDDVDSGNDSSVLAYIRHVLDHMQISPSALAKRAGISPTTLTRPLNNPRYKFNLSATTLEKIAAVSGIYSGPFFENKDYVSTALATYFDPKIYDPKVWGEQQENYKSTVIIGSASIGIWQEISMLHSDFHGAISVAPVDHSPSDCFAVSLRDSHLGSFAYPGDLLLCVRLKAWKEDLYDGQMVILERRRDGGRLVEITGRQIHKVKSGWQLNTTGRGHSAFHQILLDNLEGDPEASVTGVIICAIRHPI